MVHICEFATVATQNMKDLQGRPWTPKLFKILFLVLGIFRFFFRSYSVLSHFTGQRFDRNESCQKLRYKQLNIL